MRAISYTSPGTRCHHEERPARARHRTLRATARAAPAPRCRAARAGCRTAAAGRRARAAPGGRGRSRSTTSWRRRSRRPVTIVNTSISAEWPNSTRSSPSIRHVVGVGELRAQPGREPRGQVRDHGRSSGVGDLVIGVGGQAELGPHPADEALHDSVADGVAVAHPDRGVAELAEGAAGSRPTSSRRCTRRRGAAGPSTAPCLWSGPGVRSRRSSGRSPTRRAPRPR